MNSLTRLSFVGLCAVVLVFGCESGSKDAKESAPLPGETLFVTTPLTEPGSFTAGVEGPACDAAGNVYAVNFARDQTIGKVAPDGRAEVFVTLPGKSTGNGIVF